jgi:hypothetical protein
MIILFVHTACGQGVQLQSLCLFGAVVGGMQHCGRERLE